MQSEIGQKKFKRAQNESRWLRLSDGVELTWRCMVTIAYTYLRPLSCGCGKSIVKYISTLKLRDKELRICGWERIFHSNTTCSPLTVFRIFVTTKQFCLVSTVGFNVKYSIEASSKHAPYMLCIKTAAVFNQTHFKRLKRSFIQVYK